MQPNNFRWLYGEEYIGRYEPEHTKYFATNFFKICGSLLPWLDKMSKTVIVPAGTLDDDPGIRPMQNIFCGSQAKWFLHSNTLVQYEGLPNNNTS